MESNSLFASYAWEGIAPDRFDELCHPDGSIRSHWKPLIRALAQWTPEDIQDRMQSAQQLIQDEGVTYTIYADPKGRDRRWALDELPLVLPAAEWASLSNGISQRARLLNAILGDVYGPQNLLKQGIVPPEVIYSAGGWLPPAYGASPSNGTFLHNYAVDLLRSADGRWWVVGDRTQAPSGAGYALENRMIMTRAFPELLAQMPVASLAGYFSALRDSLVQHAPCRDGKPCIVVLTPGPLNETYYEHSLLARYLGFALVEGGDLTVRDNCVWLKTISGLQRVHAILRRQDDTFCDPLELRSDSALGVAGLMDCARRGSVFIANALGAGVVESPALQGFLPAACRYLLGEYLSLPSVATWWCGEAAAFDYVRDHLDELVIKSVYGNHDFRPVFGMDLDTDGKQQMIEQIAARPDRFVAQEWVPLPLAPILNRSSEGLGLGRRSIGLRAYAVSTQNGYQVMPGGLTRVEAHNDARVVSMQRGGASKDTWIYQEKRSRSQLFDSERFFRSTAATASETTVPSRVAENLFWMGRYSERAEGAARLLRQALLARINSDENDESAALDRVIRQCGLVALLPNDKPDPGIAMEELIRCATHPSHAQGLAQTLRQLERVGFSLRDRLSNDHWRALKQLVDDRAMDERIALGPTLVWLDRAIRRLTALSGFSLDSMVRDAGWRFLSLGRRLERLSLLASACAVAAEPLTHGTTVKSEPPHFDWLLYLTDSMGAFRTSSTGIATWKAVSKFVLLDPSNPRSVKFQIDGVQQALRRLGEQGGGHSIALEEVSVHLGDQAMKSISSGDEVRTCFVSLAKSVASLSDLLAARYFSINDNEMRVI